MFQLRSSVDSEDDGEGVGALRKEEIIEWSCRGARGEWTREMRHSRLAVVRMHLRPLVIFQVIPFGGFLLQSWSVLMMQTQNKQIQSQLGLRPLWV